MKVGFYVTEVAPKGASQRRFQRAIFEGLSRSNRSDYQYIVFSHDKLGQSYLPPNFRHEQLQPIKLEENLRSRDKGWSFGLRRKTRRFSGGYRADRFPYDQQLRNSGIRLLWNVNQHFLLSDLPTVRTVWDVNHRIHPMFPEFSSTRFGFDSLDKDVEYSLARASYIITGTQEGREQLCTLYGVYPGKIRILPYPAPQCRSQGSRSSRNRDFVVYPARLWPHKNHAVLLYAIALLRQQYFIDLECILTGADEGNLGHIISLAQKLNIHDLVIYKGEVSDAELDQLYFSAVALAHVSAVGPDNLPPLEAMSRGCPVVAAEVPGAREQLGDAALFFKANNEEELAARLAIITSDPMLRSGLVKKGYERAKRWGNVDYAHAMIDVMDDFAKWCRNWPGNAPKYT